jgi:hypothetical protein
MDLPALPENPAGNLDVDRKYVDRKYIGRKYIWIFI